MRRTVLILIGTLALCLFIGCGGNSSSDKADKYCEEGQEWKDDGCVDIVPEDPEDLTTLTLGVFLTSESETVHIEGTTNIIVEVYNETGNPVAGVIISFTLDNAQLATIAGPVSTSADGIATTVLTAKELSGTVEITANVDNYDTAPISGADSDSHILSISIVDPNDAGSLNLTAGRFSVSADVYNLPGLYFENFTTNISAYLSDRYGNFDVLEGTPVYFKTEYGLTIESQANASATGIATVTARTQGSILSFMSGPADVAPEAWEIALQGYLLSDYGYDTTAHPRDGLCSILIHTNGEEHFDDSNANGIYDTGETFIDVPQDPFCDFNENGVYDGLASSDPEEYYFDTDNSGTWEAIVNNAWDSNVDLSTNLKLLLTDEPIFMMDTTNFAVLNGGSQEIKIIVCDKNLNQLPEGTTVTISTNVGTLTGVSSADAESLEYEFKDSNKIGPDMAGHLDLIERSFTVQDDDDTVDSSEAALIVITVEWEGETYSWSIEGTID